MSKHVFALTLVSRDALFGVQEIQHAPLQLVIDSRKELIRSQLDRLDFLLANVLAKPVFLRQRSNLRLEQSVSLLKLRLAFRSFRSFWMALVVSFTCFCTRFSVSSLPSSIAEPFLLDRAPKVRLVALAGS